MQSFEQLSRELEKRGKGDALRKLAESPEGQRLAGTLDAAALEQAVKRGDAESLRRQLAAALGSEDGRRLADSIRRALQG
ncbi:MAG: hypothetical protein IJV41_03215 [Oscillospiraceae bacterium]|nr:hypothetical protein [Oscillospiraceae bacterium]